MQDIDSLARSLTALGVEKPEPVSVLLDCMGWHMLDLVFSAMENEVLQKQVDTTHGLIYGAVSGTDGLLKVTYRVIQFEELEAFIGLKWGALYSKLQSLDHNMEVCLVLNEGGRLHCDTYNKPWKP